MFSLFFCQDEGRPDHGGERPFTLVPDHDSGHTGDPEPRPDPDSEDEACGEIPGPFRSLAALAPPTTPLLLPLAVTVVPDEAGVPIEGGACQDQDGHASREPQAPDTKVGTLGQTQELESDPKVHQNQAVLVKGTIGLKKR